MHTYIINGHPRSGKDTFVDFCRGAIGEEYVCEVSTIDCVKQIAKMAGWNGTKDNRSRKFLSDLKDLFTEYNGFPMEETIKKIDEFERELRYYGVDSKGVVFVHCREPREIADLVSILNAKTILIERDSVKNTDFSNHADEEVNNYDYDIIISNNGTLNDFKSSAYQFCKEQDLWL